MQDLLRQLTELLKQLDDEDTRPQAAASLHACIRQQRQCLLAMTEAGDPGPLLGVMQSLRHHHLQWSSYEIAQQHASALVRFTNTSV